MRGQGVVRHVEPPGDVAGRQPLRFVRHQQPEHGEARGLREGGKGEDGVI